MTLIKATLMQTNRSPSMNNIKVHTITVPHIIHAVVLLSVACMMTSSAFAAPAPAGGKATPAVKIDASLLRRLTRDIARDIPDESDQPATAAKNTAAKDTAQPDGTAQPSEKMHRPQVANPAETLGRVAGAMREAGDLLGATRGKKQIRALQDRAVQDLDSLIEAARASPPPSGGAASKPKPGDQQPPPGEPKPGQPQQAGQTGATAGTASGMNTDAEAEAERSTQQAQEWIERVWGNLPERQREQLRQFGTDVFLPGYESMIEEYFKRLAEEAND
jgi:hypothetical protein